MNTAILQHTLGRMEEIIRDAVAYAAYSDTALVAMLAPGHGIPLSHTCGAVLDHDMIRLEAFSLGWDSVIGQAVSEDEPDSPLTVQIPLRDVVWVSPEIKEVK